MKTQWRGLTWLLVDHGAQHEGLYVTHPGIDESMLVAVVRSLWPKRQNLEGLARNFVRNAVDRLSAHRKVLPYPPELLLIEDDNAFIAALVAYEATA